MAITCQVRIEGQSTRREVSPLYLWTEALAVTAMPAIVMRVPRVPKAMVARASVDMESGMLLCANCGLVASVNREYSDRPQWGKYVAYVEKVSIKFGSS